MLNQSFIMGRLTRDVSITYAQSSDTTIGRFTIACERDSKPADGDQRQADFISCVAFGKTADFIAKYFRQGSMICVTGRIQTGSYTNREGQKVYTTDVIVEKAHFTGEKKAAEESEDRDYNYGRPEPSTAGDGFMNIPDGIDEELPFN